MFYNSNQVNDMLDNYYTSSNVDDMLGTLYSNTDIDEKLAMYYNSNEVNNMLDDYYTKLEVEEESDHTHTLNLSCPSNMLGNVTKCIDVSISKKTDEYFEKPYLRIHIKPTKKRGPDYFDESLMREYVYTFTYNVNELYDNSYSFVQNKHEIMFSASSQRPKIFSINNGKMSMTFNDDLNPNLSIMMYPYISSLKLSNISSKQVTDPSKFKRNSDLGIFDREKHAYIVLV